MFGLPIFNILFSSTRVTNAEASLMMYVGAVAVVFYSLSTPVSYTHLDVYKRQKQY